MTDQKVRITTNLDPETDRLLRRIAQQEFRSVSSTIALLIRLEAAERGLLARAPEVVVQRRQSDSS